VIDGVGIYDGAAAGCDTKELIGYMCEIAAAVRPGSNEVLFMPWLLGNRCPFEDADCRGGFFNVSLATKKEDLVRAVMEGVMFHIRWMLECQSAKVRTSPVIRLVGGGGRSPLLCQMLADVTRREVGCPWNPQNAGAMGAAALMAHGLGVIPSLDEAGRFAMVQTFYKPSLEAADMYDAVYPVFKRLYRSNRKNFRLLNCM
jgi:xylulokinase